MKRIIQKIIRKIFLTLMIPIWRSKYNHTGEIALCCIAKLENDYIRFFVEYYKNLHFDKIFIYDNNDPDGERFEEVIGDYIQSQFVEIVDFRGKIAPQLEAYQDCYDRINKSYEWIAFFDCDEFLTFVDENNDIHSFLNQKLFESYQIVQFNWMIYGDNEMLDNDGRNVIERFPNPIFPYDFIINDNNFPVNFHVKKVLRGGLNNITWINAHNIQRCFYKVCNPSGEPTGVSSNQAIDYQTAYLRHYRTKSIGEWINNKMRQGDVFYIGEKAKQNNSLETFYKYNKRTQEKEKYAEKVISQYHHSRL